VLGQAARTSGFAPQMHSARLRESSPEGIPASTDPTRPEVFDFEHPQARAA
jgi:hypothetical protein